MIVREKQKRSVSVAATITLVYMAVGLLWIYFSDPFLLTFTQDAELTSRLQSSKGWMFIFISAGLLYVLIRVMTGRIERSHRRTALAYQATIDSLVGAIELRDIGTGSIPIGW